MTKSQKLVCVVIVALGWGLANASPAIAQVEYWPWAPAVPSVNEPYMYYHPQYQPVRSTTYWVPNSYARPYRYRSPRRNWAYYYVPSTGSVRLWVR